MGLKISGAFEKQDPNYQVIFYPSNKDTTKLQKNITSEYYKISQLEQ